MLRRFRAAARPPAIPDPDKRNFTMPAEEEPHEGTWLQWPHNRTTSRHGKDKNLIERYEPAWIQMTKALHTGEKVHLIVYDDVYRERIRQRLEEEGCDMNQIDFFVYPTDDVWCRDNGPVFVRDHETNALHITDWGFNGWGKQYDYKLSNEIPKLIAKELNMPITTIPMVNEGGSVEVDGNGTLMAKQSSVLHHNRNPGWTQQDAEAYFSRYLGVTNFIWLKGTPGLDITDDHIDGTARFAPGNTIVTFFRDDFEDPREYDQLQRAANVAGEKYNIVHLPLTTMKVVNRDYGFYINYYVGNEVVLMPSFDDPSDDEAMNILQAVYTDRKIVMVPMKEVLKDGGMMHCVTQQQPLA
jgi:agmatine deiminase